MNFVLTNVSEQPGYLDVYLHRESKKDKYYIYLSVLLFWRRKWQPTPVFLPGESHGQRDFALEILGSLKQRQQGIMPGTQG